MGFGSYCNHKTCTVNQWPTTPTQTAAITTSTTTTTTAVVAAAAAAAAAAAMGKSLPLSVSPHRHWYANKNIYCGSNKHCVSYNNNRDFATAVAANQEQMFLLQLPLLFVVSSSSDAAAVATTVNY
uniref:Uncharacterized protein n=1 Tax=Bactrocera dorsalis TaxID=27457 RepID=A0A034V960_BACDO